MYIYEPNFWEAVPTMEPQEPINISQTENVFFPGQTTQQHRATTRKRDVITSIYIDHCAMYLVGTYM